MGSHQIDNNDHVDPKGGNAQDTLIDDIVEKIPWDKVAEKAAKEVFAAAKGMAANYALKKGIEVGKVIAEYAKEGGEELIDEAKDIFQDFEEAISPKTLSKKQPSPRRLKRDEEHDERRKPLPSRQRDQEFARRPSYPPPRRAHPSQRTRAPDSPLEGRGRGRGNPTQPLTYPLRTRAPDSPLEGRGRGKPPQPLPYALAPPPRRREALLEAPPSTTNGPDTNKAFQRASRPGPCNSPSDEYGDRNLRGLPTPIRKQSTQVQNSNVPSVRDITESLDINAAIIEQHVLEAESAKTRLANEQNHERVYFLSRLAKLNKWMTSNESKILIVNGNDATHRNDQPFSIFSSYINTVVAWFNDSAGARPLHCFAGAHEDLDHTVNKAHTLMRSLCWQMLNQYPIEAVRRNPTAGQFVNTIAQLNRAQICWLFEELYYQFTLLDAKESDNGQLIILVDGGHFLEEGLSRADFSEFYTLLQRVVVERSGGRRANVFKVLILFPGKASELCREVNGVVDVLKLPDNMPKPQDVRR